MKEKNMTKFHLVMKHRVKWLLDIPCSMLEIQKFLILGFIFALSTTSLVCAQQAELMFTQKPDEFMLYNTNNQKMYSYYLLPSKENITLSASNLDTLEIYSRIFFEQKANSRSYEYMLTYNAVADTIHKTCKQSSVTRGVNGQAVSTYNKSLITLAGTQNGIKIQNIFSKPILFKFEYNSPTNFSSQHEYIAYSPDVYSDEKVLVLNDKEYTYYEPNSNKISLDLEGPIYLKIISRVIFDMPTTKKIDYQFDVYDNSSLLASFSEVGYKSSKSILTNNIEHIPSTGDVNILHFDKGAHHIEIRKTSNNHEVMFRFYINKTAVYVGDR